MEYLELDLETMAGGAVLDRVREAIARVVENIRDPNTDATATRKISLTLTFKPAEDRQNVAVKSGVKVNMAPASDILVPVSVVRVGGQLKAMTANHRQEELELASQGVTDINEAKAAKGGE